MTPNGDDRLTKPRECNDTLRTYVRGIAALAALITVLAVLLALPTLVVLAWKLLWWAVQLEM